MENSKEIYLFLVVLGGKAKKANVELHDVRWVIGSKIEDTYKLLRRDWFGELEGLHIDSYKKINFVDGYKINIKNIDDKKTKNNNSFIGTSHKNNLWFVNIGGYDPCSMQEKHEFGLVVASSSSEAKNKAKTKWLNGCKKKHKDNIHSLRNFGNLDDCELIKTIDNCEIELSLDDNFVEETNYPDWYGYKKLDNI
ncbi:DUF1543 domain-containing protein [bacterium]|nr:DUF1543 domain-containing protein [bacterium]